MTTEAELREQLEQTEEALREERRRVAALKRRPSEPELLGDLVADLLWDAALAAERQEHKCPS